MNTLKENVVVEIPDSALNTLLHNVLMIPDNQDITSDELATLTEINANGLGIRDLTGIQYCTSLLAADFSYNEIIDFSPLSSLIRLTALNISRNVAKSIAPLAALTNLRELDVTELLPAALQSANYLDLTPCMAMAELHELKADLNSIADLSVIAKLTTLTTLLLNTNPITSKNASALSTLTSLTHLELGETYIIDLSFVSPLYNITTLGISHTPVVDISPIADLSKLSVLYLNNCSSIQSLVPISGMTSLTFLQMTGVPVDPTPISTLTSLEILGVNMCDISDISFVSTLTNLKEFYFQQNLVSDLTPLASCTKLSLLYAVTNIISDLTPLSSIKGLKALYVQENRITDITPVINLPMLSVFFFSYNFVTDAKQIQALPSIISDNTHTYEYNFATGLQNQRALQANAPFDMLVNEVMLLEFSSWYTPDGTNYEPMPNKPQYGIYSMSVTSSNPDIVTLDNRSTDNGLSYEATARSVGEVALYLKYNGDSSHSTFLPFVTNAGVTTSVSVNVTAANT